MSEKLRSEESLSFAFVYKTDGGIASPNEHMHCKEVFTAINSNLSLFMVLIEFGPPILHPINLPGDHPK